VSGEASALGKATPEREWWLRTLAIFQSPGSVFGAFRDDSDEQARAREEPVLAIILLAGVATVAGTGVIGRLVTIRADGLVLAVLTFIAGALYGVATYWIGGAALFVGLKGAGSQGTFRRARQLVAYAAAPLALSLLVLWPLRFALYGRGALGVGNGEAGAGHVAFVGAQAVFYVWSFALLVLGIRVVHDWTFLRALGAVVVAVLALLAVAFVLDPQVAESIASN
jgi:hypothetical protein